MSAEITPHDPYLEILAADDPIPGIARLRQGDPVHFVAPLGFWFVTRHEDVRRLLHDPGNVTHDKRVWERFVPAPEGSFMRWAEERSLFAQSPAEHARTRRLVSAAFTPRAVRRMEGQIRDVVERVAAPLLGRGGEVIDLLGGFAKLVPYTVIGRITGIPPGDDEARFRELAQSAITAFFPFTPPELRDAADAALRELSTWVREMCARRRASPEEDLVSDLVHARDANECLSEDDVVLFVTALVAAGSETTAIAAAQMVRVLLELPEAMARLRAEPALVARSIDEMIRFALGGAAGTLRYAVRDFTLRGREIREGQMIMLSFAGANRDPAVYADPDRLELDREVRELLSFGHGPHYCLGANLARVEVSCMLEALLRILPPGSRVREDRLEIEDAGLLRRPRNLPVEIGTA
ncbi:MAG: cytochrome P450 [Myxococcota bacterium]|nr:cytochrome P450 [Myxococcota bacterium]